jgi:hypothetical protein
MPTSTATGTTPQAVLQNIQTNYGSQAEAVGHTAGNIYLAHLGTLQFISAIVSIFFIAMAIYILVKTGIVGNRVDKFQDIIMRNDVTKKRAVESWDEIERHFFAGDDNDLKIALIKADALLDEALQGAGVQGKDIGERLQNIRAGQLPNLEAVWQAHKIRNQIAHEPDFVVKRDLAERALTVYETALESLGVLEKENGENSPPSATPDTSKPKPPTAPKSH